MSILPIEIRLIEVKPKKKISPKAICFCFGIYFLYLQKQLSMY